MVPLKPAARMARMAAAAVWPAPTMTMALAPLDAGLGTDGSILGGLAPRPPPPSARLAPRCARPAVRYRRRRRRPRLSPRRSEYPPSPARTAPCRSECRTALDAAGTRSAVLDPAFAQQGERVGANPRGREDAIGQAVEDRRIPSTFTPSTPPSPIVLTVQTRCHVMMLDPVRTQRIPINASQRGRKLGLPFGSETVPQVTSP